MPESPVKDKNYNLVSVLHMSLEKVWRRETYIQDAEREGDSDLANWFRQLQESGRKAGEGRWRSVGQLEPDDAADDHD